MGLDFIYALLSYQEIPPQLPTRSCCDGLLFVVDIWPEGFGKGGVCCLCEYVVAKHPDFDLAGAYLACCGKDVDAVKISMRARRAAATPTSFSFSTRRRHNEVEAADRARRRGHRRIVLGALAGGALLGWCIYYFFFSAAAKEHRSPDPSNRGAASDASQQGQHDHGMSR
ncbi:uncharacterized protein LOC120667571 [Panicum virgatum]|uniref:uncharacterized protein LOC120667571 n=1 Tax=Panicum virgatum TaxID=38727 RepID=UPI0019D4FB95|nr:uncharacterized protein LOC120667571 [Panicum virgatum]